MWWLAIAAGVFFFRDRIAKLLAPILPDASPARLAFFCQCAMLLAALIYVVPLELVGFGVVKRPAYLMSIWATTVSCIFTLKGAYGAPPMPENFSFGNIRNIKQIMMDHLPKIQPWLINMQQSNDFHALFFSLIFLTAQPSMWVLLIVGRRSLWQVCTDSQKNRPDARLWKMFAGTWEKLSAQKDKVLLYDALAQILLGLWLVVALFLPMRQILTALLYWNYLRMRYQSPRAGAVNLQAWNQLGQNFGPILRIVEKTPLKKALDYAKNWFETR